jgi:O-antigen ligase
MTALESIRHLGDRARGRRWPAWLLPGVCLAGIVPYVAIATRLSMLNLALALVAAVVIGLVGFRWPLLPLLVFVVFVPIEEVVLIDGIGTLSRLAGILFAVSYGIPRIARLAFNAMPPAGWAYFGWSMASLGWALDPTVAWAELSTLIQLFLIALLVADFVIEHPTLVRPVLWAYSLSAAASALVGIVVYIDLGSATQRAAAITHQNPAQFAAILLPGLVFGLYEIVSGRQRVLGAGVALLTSLGVVVSGTRGAWVAVVVVVLFLVLREASLRRKVATIGSVLILGAVVYSIPGVSDLLALRAGNAVSTGGAGRTDIWTIGSKIYESSPLLGVGYANFPVAYTQDLVRSTNVSYTLSGYGPHNLVVGTIAELGPIGLLLLAGFVGPYLLRRGWGPEAAAIQASLISLMTLALFLDILSNRKQVWLVIGIAAGLGFLERRRGVPGRARESQDRPAVGRPDGPVVAQVRRSVGRPQRSELLTNVTPGGVDPRDE